jgi:Holliday junction resolvase-like predicted endonuclease
MLKEKVSNERKNLHRLAGEFLVASRLTQRGYMVSLQWGTTIGYDILAFDKAGHVAFIEVKATASNTRRWVLQKKYAHPREDRIPASQRFVCCVDLAVKGREPDIYVFPAATVAGALHYYFSSKFPKSSSYHLSLDFKPQHRTKEPGVQTVGQFIDADQFRERYELLGVEAVQR